MSICNDSNSAILSVDQPAHVNWRMGQGIPGSYDGLILRPGGDSTWRKQPNNVPLKSGKFFVPQGYSIPLRSEEIYQVLPDESMFIFAKNVSSPACCPSTYSTSGGCVCTTEQQRKYINQYRANNKNYPSGGF